MKSKDARPAPCANENLPLRFHNDRKSGNPSLRRAKYPALSDPSHWGSFKFFDPVVNDSL